MEERDNKANHCDHCKTESSDGTKKIVAEVEDEGMKWAKLCPECMEEHLLVISWERWRGPRNK